MSDFELQNLLIKGIFESSPEGILVVDDKNIIVTHNPQFVEIWQIPGELLHGVEPGTAIGLDDSRILSSAVEQVKDQQAFLARVKDLYDNPQLQDICEIEMVDGRTVERHSTVLKNSDGQYAGRVWFFRDITEFKQLENVRDLMAAQEKYHTILKTATDGFWTVNKYGRFLEVNDAYCTMSGYSRNELLNMHIPDLEVAESAEDTRSHIEKIITNGSDRFETRHRRKDGEIINVEVSTQFMPLVDQMLVVFVKDITERKRTEADLIAAKEDAELANNAKSQFLSSMSHELRTPLNSILGFAQLMACNDALSAEHKDFMREILKAGDHLLELINDVLDLAKIEAGHIDLSLEPVEVCAVVDECLSLVSNLASKRSVQISHNGLQGVMVRADRIRLRQALLNLLSNAIKYNREGGSVKLKVQPEGQKHLRILVTDTGNGITAKHLTELFQPFNRLDAENSGIEGTGIGLTITRRIVEMMGGTVDVQSEVGVGSTFWIELPLESMVETVLPDEVGADIRDIALTAQHQAPQRTVLYIEDNHSNIKLVAHIFGQRKHVHLLTARTPALGIELARTRHPDLILLDINMPGMNGYEVLEVIKTDARLKAVPIVAITANAMSRDIERGLAAGFAAYLTKPLNIVKFYSVLDKILETSDTSMGAS
jgi:PAS domain S-box-containing protein